MVVNETQQYLDARYVSTSESCWQLFSFDLHNEKPDIQLLQLQLLDYQTVTFHDGDDARTVVSSKDVRKTRLTEWFVWNKLFEDAQTCTYQNFPQNWVWNNTKKTWHKLTRGFTIGRMYFVFPIARERYYVCLLLAIVIGAKSFEELRYYNEFFIPHFNMNV